LTNTCGADQTAKDTCATAQTAAAAAAPGTGAQADAFNAVFLIQTDFAAVQEIDNQGNPVAGTGSSSATASADSTATATDASSATSTTASSASSGIGNFGSCTVPEIEFGAGFDGRKETSFEPTDETSYDHGSAQNIDIITQFICNTLTNTCGADATAKVTCATASAAADAAAAGTGAQADAFNAAFNIKTNFANVTPLDDQGTPVGASNLAASTTANSASQTAATTTAAPPPASTAASGSLGLQTFTEALGGVSAPAVTASSDGKFQVAGVSSEFNTAQSAVQRSCDVQNNDCANAANASKNQNGFTVAACTAQQQKCSAAAQSS